MHASESISRRRLLAGALGAGLGLASLRRCPAAEAGSPWPVCAFIKFIQSLPFDQLAETLAEAGFDGVEATVRGGGYILPERVEDQLPLLVEALRKHGLRTVILTTDINRVDQPNTERVLRTASSLGIKQYRMSYYRYDLDRPVASQLDEFQPLLAELADLNRQLGIQAVYQNHAGAKYVGASCWDLWQLIRELAPEAVGAAFDIRHAMVEGGLCWPVYFNLLRPRIAAVFVKDFSWQDNQPENVALGQGRVGADFFRSLRQAEYRGPLSLHIEYLEDAGLEPNLAALRDDRKILAGWLAQDR